MASSAAWNTAAVIEKEICISPGIPEIGQRVLHAALQDGLMPLQIGTDKMC